MTPPIDQEQPVILLLLLRLFRARCQRIRRNGQNCGIRADQRDGFSLDAWTTLALQGNVRCSREALELMPLTVTDGGRINADAGLLVEN